MILYINIKKDPPTSKLNNIKSCLNSYPFTADSGKLNRVPSCTKCDRLTALPKVHIPGIPFYSIVSNINSATYKLAKHF